MSEHGGLGQEDLALFVVQADGPPKASEPPRCSHNKIQAEIAYLLTGDFHQWRWRPRRRQWVLGTKRRVIDLDEKLIAYSPATGTWRLFGRSQGAGGVTPELTFDSGKTTHGVMSNLETARAAQQQVEHLSELIERREAMDRTVLTAEVQNELARLRAREEAGRLLTSSLVDPHVWDAIPLDGSSNAPVPITGRREDGAAMFYPGCVNGVFGTSESGKTWLCLYVVAQLIAAGASVVFIDYEDGPAGMYHRLVDVLGCDPETVLEKVTYFSATAPFTEREKTRWKHVFAKASLVVIDATTEALASSALDSNKDTDVAKFFNELPRWVASLGPAVVLIDHVTKSRETRTQPSGSQHKKSAIDGVLLNVVPRVPFRPGASGVSSIVVAKDRHGGVRSVCVDRPGQGAVFGDFKIDPEGFSLQTSTDPAGSSDHAAEFEMRATISRTLLQLHDDYPVVSQKKLFDTIKIGNSGRRREQAIDSLRWLEEEKYLSREPNARGGGHGYVSLRPWVGLEGRSDD